MKIIECVLDVNTIKTVFIIILLPKNCIGELIAGLFNGKY